MSVSIFVSTAFDNPRTIVSDLLAAVGAHNAKASLGVLFCNSQTEYAFVCEKVAEALPFPVIGGTALGFPFADAEGGEVSAALMVLEKEGMEVAVTVSAPLDQTVHAAQMRETFTQCRAALGSAPKFVMPFFPLMPGMPTGLFIDDIFGLCEGIPVFGGTTTNDLIRTRAAVFANGRAHGDSMVLVMLGGDIRPVFSTANLVSPTVEYAPTVTASVGGEVLRVDENAYCDYMRTIGISPEDRINGVDALMQYGPTPVLLECPGVPENDVPTVRCISYTDLQKGSAFFSGPVPEGTKLRMSILRTQDVAVSTEHCLEKLRSRMRPALDEGYVYEALFCISCVARYFVLVGDHNAEREILEAGTPEGMARMGFYAFCEIGPAYTKDGGALVNRAHSASIALCAL